MQGACQRCKLHDKSAVACAKRKCFFAVYEIDNPKECMPRVMFPLRIGETLDMIGLKLYVTDINWQRGNFIGKVLNCDYEKDIRGIYHYVDFGRYYFFELIDAGIAIGDTPSLIWELPGECTDVFRRDGKIAGQFLIFYDRWAGFWCEIRKEKV